MLRDLTELVEEMECNTCWRWHTGRCIPLQIKSQSGTTACVNHETAPARVNREVRVVGKEIMSGFAMEKVGEEPPPKPKPKPKREFNREAFTTGVYRFLVVVLLFVIALGVWLGPYSIINTIR